MAEFEVLALAALGAFACPRHFLGRQGVYGGNRHLQQGFARVAVELDR